PGILAPRPALWRPYGRSALDSRTFDGMSAGGSLRHNETVCLELLRNMRPQGRRGGQVLLRGAAFLFVLLCLPPPPEAPRIFGIQLEGGIEIGDGVIKVAHAQSQQATDLQKFSVVRAQAIGLVAIGQRAFELVA